VEYFARNCGADWMWLVGFSFPPLRFTEYFVRLRLFLDLSTVDLFKHYDSLSHSLLCSTAVSCPALVDRFPSPPCPNARASRGRHHHLLTHCQDPRLQELPHLSQTIRSFIVTLSLSPRLCSVPSRRTARPSRSPRTRTTRCTIDRPMSIAALSAVRTSPRLIS